MTATVDSERILPPARIQPSYPWIIFDMDGTLVDSLGLVVASFNFAARRFLQRELRLEEIKEIHGARLEDQLANYVPRSSVALASERYHRFFAAHFNPQSVFPGIRILLFKLERRGIKLAVCTGASERSADIILVQSGLIKFFTAVVTSEDTTMPKPHPEGLRITMNIIGAETSRTVYVGDHPNDIKASLRAGVKSAAALWGSKCRDALIELKPDFIFRDPAEALRLSAYQVSYANKRERQLRSPLGLIHITSGPS
jgi:HAD superfamily hydrolase (TIGR01509 family)